MTARLTRSAYILTGPTASGKTACAHEWARINQWPILSADAMLVYSGMDIGTAKPNATEQREVRYGGLNCVPPDTPFSVGAYLEVARAFLETIPADQPLIVTGGTGLYIKALIKGLDPMPDIPPDIRQAVEACYNAGGIPALQTACQVEAPLRYAALKDPQNPRRLMRALELTRAGAPEPPTSHQIKLNTTPCLLLDMPRDQLDARITARVDQMYTNGLLDEVQALRKHYPQWSPTAQKAIGYQEALAVLDGTCTDAEARALTVQRTRRYARRQMTWFRHQLVTTEVEVDATTTPAELVAQFTSYGNTYGPVTIQA